MTRSLRVAAVAVLVAALTAGAVGACAPKRTPPAGSDTAGASTGAVSGDQQRHLRLGSLDRTYDVHIPAGRGNPAGNSGVPAVLLLHGRLGTAEGMEKLAHFDQVADRNSFVAVYPQGYQRSWADARGATPASMAGVDDVAFISAVIDAIVRDDHVDPDRVYVAGLSNGAMMSQTLGCELAGKIAGIAPVAGPAPASLAGTCHPARPMPVLEIHGTADPYVPYAGGPLGGGERGTVQSVEATVARWRDLDHCAAKPTTATLPDRVEDGTHVRLQTATRCAPHASVALYTVVNGGHTWPGGEQYLPVAIVGPTSRQFDAGQLIWDFFAGTPRRAP
jgi:polyhydroxybutyrate depolymerase